MPGVNAVGDGGGAQVASASASAAAAAAGDGEKTPGENAAEAQAWIDKWSGKNKDQPKMDCTGDYVNPRWESVEQVRLYDEQRSYKQSGHSYARHRASKLSSRSSSTF